MDDKMLYVCLVEADNRKQNKELSLEVRARSAETYAMLLKVAASRGYDFKSLQQSVTFGLQAT